MAKEDGRFVIVTASRSQLSKMLIPDPSHLVGAVVLIFREPKLAFFPNHIEDLQW